MTVYAERYFGDLRRSAQVVALAGGRARIVMDFNWW